MEERPRRTGRVIVSAAVGACLLLGAGAVIYAVSRPPASTPAAAAPDRSASQQSAAPESRYSYQRKTGPDRTEIVGPDGVLVATMTDGSRTAHLVGPERSFAEARFTPATVTHKIWARLAPQEWSAGAESAAWFAPWLAAALPDRSPDILAVSMQYVYGATPEKDGQGLQVAGDAAFGPLSETDPDGRAENSDFYDYLGITWKGPEGKTEKPSASHARSLDCSGFLRMVYGYRLGYPLLGTNGPGAGLPRQAFAMAEATVGRQLMPNTGKRAKGLDLLLPGDLLFFNAGPKQGANIEHSGMYLGVDDRGHHRFISSRATANGPTMGDAGGESILDGTGYWGLRLRTARRL